MGTVRDPVTFLNLQKSEKVTNSCTVHGIPDGITRRKIEKQNRGFKPFRSGKHCLFDVKKGLPIRKVLPFSGKIFFCKSGNNLILPISRQNFFSQLLKLFDYTSSGLNFVTQVLNSFVLNFEHLCFAILNLFRISNFVLRILIV